MPGSQTGLPHDRQQDLVGTGVVVRVIKVVPERANIVVSLREVPSGPALARPDAERALQSAVESSLEPRHHRDVIGLVRALARFDVARDLRASYLAERADALADEIFFEWHRASPGPASAWAIARDYQSLTSHAWATRLRALGAAGVAVADDELLSALAPSSSARVCMAALSIVRERADGIGVFGDALRCAVYARRGSDVADAALGVLAFHGDDDARRELVARVECVHSSEAFAELARLDGFRDELRPIARRVLRAPVTEAGTPSRRQAAEFLVEHGDNDDIAAVLDASLNGCAYAWGRRLPRALASDVDEPRHGDVG